MARRFNITAKMLGYLLAVSILPLMLLGATAFEISKRIVIAQAEAENARLVGSFSAYLRLYNDQVEDMAANIAGNAAIGQALRRADAHAASGFENLETRAQMGYILNSYVRVRGLVSIDLFSVRGEHFHVGEPLAVDSVTKEQSNALLKEAVVAKSPTRWRGIDDNLNPGSQQKQVISVVRAIQHFSPVSGKSDVVGLLVISLSDEITRSFLDGVALMPGTQLLQLDRNGRIALHSDSRQFGLPMTPALLQLIRSTPPVPQLTLDGQDMLMNVTPYDDQERMVVVLSPRQALTEKVNQLALATALLVGLGLLIILAFLWHFQRTMVQPIRAVSSGFGRLKRHPNREHHPLPVQQAQDEIGQLVLGYNEHLLALQSQREASDGLQRSEAVLRATEIQLRDSEARMRAILDEMPVGVFLVNAQDQIFLRNRHFVEMFGYSEAEIPDVMTWWKLAHPDPQYRQLVRQILDANRHTTPDGGLAWAPRVYQVNCKNGDVLHVEVAGVSTASGYICTFVDHTQHQQHQAQLELAKRQAESANHTKSDFLATMSHEIRTPMNAILGMLKLLEHTELSTRQKDYSHKAQAATQALLGIINDVLDFSKVEAGKMELDIDSFSLSEVMRDLSALLSASPRSRSIEVLFDVAAGVPDRLLGDAMRLRQVLLNLSANAIKFTEHGEVVVRVRVVERDASEVKLEFSVSDTGIGIAQDKLAYIFEGFSQAESSTSRRFGGTGLGLAISKRLVGLMGAELQVNSALGQGSRFYFVVNMPVAHVLYSPPAINTIAIQDGAPGAKGTRVLIVDDNPVARDILQSMGESLGWRCDVVASGEDALEQLNEPAAQPYQIVLVDSHMPGLDGWETTRRIRALELSLPQPMVLMVSAQGRDKYDTEFGGDTDSVNGYLVKPITTAMLVDAVVEAQTRQAGTAAAHVHAVASALNQPTPRLAGLHLLVVEDNLLNQQIALELLSRQGATVDIAGGGLAGVQSALDADPPFDAVLMDVQMPDLDGLEATRRIRAHSRLHNMPIIAMTANVMDSDKTQCLAAGMVDHVGKPIDVEQLVAALLRHTTAQVQPTKIDLDGAVTRMGGDRALYDKVVRSFRTDAPEQFQALEHAVQHAFWEDGVRYAHTLKGLAATVGAVALVQQAATTEADLKAVEFSGLIESALVDAVLVALGHALERALQALQQWVPEDPVAPSLVVGGVMPVGPERQQLVESLGVLAALLADHNMRSTVLSAELVKLFGDAVGQPLTDMNALVQRLAFAPAQAQCQSLRDSLI